MLATCMKSRQAAIAFIFVTVMLDMLALGLIAPVLPKLILDFLGGNMNSAANWNGVFGTVFALMQFFFSPVLGVLSDRYGRRPVFLLSNLRVRLVYIVMALSPTIASRSVGPTISGMTASSIPTAMAYIADVVPKEKRAGAFGMIGVAFGLGFILGPGVGGPLGDIDVRLPFWVAGGFSLANWLYGYLFVPESLRDEHRKEFTLRRANPLGSLALLRSHPELSKLATLQFLAYVSHEVFVIWALYAIYRFTWSQTTIGVSLAIVGIFTAAISGGLTGRIVAWLGERRTLYIGQFFGAVGMVIAGLARNGIVYMASIPVISLWNISFPAAQGMMTHRVSEREQGELQGAIQSLRSIAFVIGPFLFSGIFAWFMNPKHLFHVPGAPYYLAAALLFTAMLLATRVEQPQFDQPGEKPLEPAEAVPTEGIASGAVASVVDPAEENV